MYTSKGYFERAEECVRLANLAADQLVQSDLLRLRQTYLQIANRLDALANGNGTSRMEAEPPEAS